MEHSRSLSREYAMTTVHSAATDPRTEAATTPSANPSDRIRIEQHSAAGLFWAMGWLFSIGFLQLPFWKGALAVLVWPYYLGVALTGLVR
jgi:hypothetical protein